MNNFKNLIYFMMLSVWQWEGAKHEGSATKFSKSVHIDVPKDVEEVEAPIWYFVSKKKFNGYNVFDMTPSDHC